MCMHSALNVQACVKVRRTLASQSSSKRQMTLWPTGLRIIPCCLLNLFSHFGTYYCYHYYCYYYICVVCMCTYVSVCTYVSLNLELTDWVRMTGFVALELSLPVSSPHSHSTRTGVAGGSSPLWFFLRLHFM